MVYSLCLSNQLTHFFAYLSPLGDYNKTEVTIDFRILQLTEPFHVRRKGYRYTNILSDTIELQHINLIDYSIPKPNLQKNGNGTI